MRVIYERRMFMGKNYEKLGDEIITRLGGEQNITKLFHCATRLRFQLADMSKADLEGIKKRRTYN